MINIRIITHIEKNGNIFSFRDTEEYWDWQINRCTAQPIKEAYCSLRRGDRRQERILERKYNTEIGQLRGILTIFIFAHKADMFLDFPDNLRLFLERQPITLELEPSKAKSIVTFHAPGENITVEVDHNIEPRTGNAHPIFIQDLSTRSE